MDYFINSFVFELLVSKIKDVTFILCCYLLAVIKCIKIDLPNRMYNNKTVGTGALFLLFMKKM